MDDKVIVVPTPVNPVVVKGAIAFSAEHARIWAEGTDQQVEELGGEHSSKVWAVSAIGESKEYTDQKIAEARGEITNQINENSLNVLSQSYAYTNGAIDTEVNARQSADSNLQTQIDALAASSDVTDIVGTYAELQAYDTSKLKDNDIIKVLDDSTHGDAPSYYRWDKETSTFSYVGSESASYTKAETDNKFLTKTDATSTYLTQSNAASTYLTQSSAASTYATQSALSTGLATKASTADGVTITDSGSAISTVAVKEQRANTAIKQWVGTKAQYDAITKDEDTLYIVTDDNQGGSGGTDLESIDGYNANVPVQRLSNLQGNFKWQTKEVWYYNFNANNSLLANVTLPNSITSIDLIFEINTKLETHAQNLFVLYRPDISSGLFFAPSSGSYYQGHFGELGYYNALTDTMNWLGDTIPNVNTKKWIRIKGTDSNQNIYTLDDDNYTIETLPALDSWTLRGTMAEQFSTYQVGFSSASQNYASGTLLNYYLKANEQVVFDLRQGDNVTLTNNTAYLYNAIQEKEHWN